MDSLYELRYECSNQKCGNTQVLRYWHDEKPIAVTCCVKCRAGFGIDLSDMFARHIGMFPKTA